ncbi:MAG: transcriptional regulator PpsR [Pseudomonadota bacterium]
MPVPEAFVSLVSAVSDIAVIVDGTGQVRDLIWNMETPRGFNPKTLIGHPMEDLVTEECRPKIRDMLDKAEADDRPKWREINHLIGGIDEFPMRYQAVPAGDATIFLGHEMQAIATLQSRLVEAQRALDEDYGRLRQLETRYRVLFQTSNEALVIAGGKRHKVQEVNAAAARLLTRDAEELNAKPLEELFRGEDQVMVQEVLDRVTSTGDSERFNAELAGTGVQIDCKISAFRAVESMMMLCSFSTSDRRNDDEPAIEEMLVGMVGRMPDAMVLTDEDGVILWCNEAFLGMSEVPMVAQARGEMLSRFMGRPGVDMDIIISNAREHGRLRAFTSLLVGTYGSETRVEVSVAALSDAGRPSIGFVIRDISRFDQIPARKPSPSSESVSDLMQLVGSVPLKELVRASTEEIEKMCIEAALKKTGNNRASAAEILGLSRQSLYVKLRRFGLLESGGR